MVYMGSKIFKIIALVQQSPGFHRAESNIASVNFSLFPV